MAQSQHSTNTYFPLCLGPGPTRSFWDFRRPCYLEDAPAASLPFNGPFGQGAERTLLSRETQKLKSKCSTREEPLTQPLTVPPGQAFRLRSQPSLALRLQGPGWGLLLNKSLPSAPSHLHFMAQPMAVRRRALHAPEPLERLRTATAGLAHSRAHAPQREKPGHRT